jgi:hypothetical protein
MLIRIWAHRIPADKHSVIHNIFVLQHSCKPLVTCVVMFVKLMFLSLIYQTTANIILLEFLRLNRKAPITIWYLPPPALIAASSQEINIPAYPVLE